MVGILGDIRFRVSDRRVLTFKTLKREISASWSAVERIGLKPLTEYGGPNLQTITMEITLDASLKVSPAETLDLIEQMVEAGEVNELIIGGRQIGNYKWAITKSSEVWDRVLRGGELYRATVSLTLQEYV